MFVLLETALTLLYLGTAFAFRSCTGHLNVIGECYFLLFKEMHVVSVSLRFLAKMLKLTTIWSKCESVPT